MKQLASGSFALPASAPWLRLQCRRGAWLGVVAIAVLSLLPGDESISFGLIDKIEHFLAYAALGCVALLGWRERHPRRLLVPAMLVFGGLLEAAQFGVPGRLPDYLDIAANVAGTGLGVALAFALERFARRIADRYRG